MKKFSLSMFLLLFEAIFFYACCHVLDIDWDTTNRFAVVLLVFLVVFNHYTITSTLIWDEMRSLLKACFSFAIVSLLVIDPSQILSGMLLKIAVLAIFMYIVCIFWDRTLRVIFRKFLAKRTLVIGTGSDANRLGEIAGHNRFALTNVMGYVKYGEKVVDPELAERMTDWKEHDKKYAFKIYEYKDLDKILKEKDIQQVIIALDSSAKVDINKITENLYEKVDEIKYLPDVGGMMTFDSKVQDFDGMLLISTAKGKMSFLGRVFKRMIDIVGSICGLFLLIPLTLYVRYKNRKAGDTDPIFFVQERIGRNGKPIKIYKYRTMVPNAEKLLDELMEKDPAIREEYLTNKKLVNDPRITDAGHFLRKTSLDEFPQFINVFKGEMSLVGPRPYLLREKEDMGIYYNSVIQCKPGITGMWQAHGRSDVGFEDRCKLDDYYLKNWTMWLDVIIIYKTVKSVIYGKGAL